MYAAEMSYQMAKQRMTELERQAERERLARRAGASWRNSLAHRLYVLAKWLEAGDKSPKQYKAA